jgi:hypothetical protein
VEIKIKQKQQRINKMKQGSKSKTRNIAKYIGIVTIAALLLSHTSNAQRVATATGTITITVVSKTDEMSADQKVISNLNQNDFAGSTLSEESLSSNGLYHQSESNYAGKPEQQSLSVSPDPNQRTRSILDEKGILYLRSFDQNTNDQTGLSENNETLTIVSVTD